jgi:hypothetical protein
MTDTLSTTVWAALDGDDIGRRLEQLIATDDEAGLLEFTTAVDARMRGFVLFVEQHQGRVVVFAGDSLLCRLSLASALQLCKTAISAVDQVSFSCGIGSRMSQAMLALKLAKARGRAQFVVWDDLDTQKP